MLPRRILVSAATLALALVAAMPLAIAGAEDEPAVPDLDRTVIDVTDGIAIERPEGDGSGEFDAEFPDGYYDETEIGEGVVIEDETEIDEPVVIEREEAVAPDAPVAPVAAPQTAAGSTPVAQQQPIRIGASEPAAPQPAPAPVEVVVVEAPAAPAEEVANDDGELEEVEEVVAQADEDATTVLGATIERAATTVPASTTSDSAGLTGGMIAALAVAALAGVGAIAFAVRAAVAGRALTA
jgi:hypothetical protein